jgi:hypothetical protein
MASTWALSTDGQRPHQFRTKNDLIKPQQTRSKSNGNPAKSTNLIDIRPLITVWLHVRVLPGPPRKRSICRSKSGSLVHGRISGGRIRGGSSTRWPRPSAQHGVGPACFCSSRQAFFSSAAPTRPRCVRAVVMAVRASFFGQSSSTALWGSGISVRGTNFHSSHRPAEQICNKSTAGVVAAKCQDCDDDRNPDEGAEQSPHEGPEEDGKQHDEG